MAWTDYSNTAANAWDSQMGAATNKVGLSVNTTTPPDQGVFPSSNLSLTAVNNLVDSYNIPGFEDGYAPTVPNPIANNIDTGGGGSVRPSSGFIYPRGDN